MRKQLLSGEEYFSSASVHILLQRAPRYVLVMKNNKGKEAGFTRPLLKDLIDRQNVASKVTFDGVFKNADLSGSTPLDPPALYEDSGTGYNSNFTFPQD